MPCASRSQLAICYQSPFRPPGSMVPRRPRSQSADSSAIANFGARNRSLTSHGCGWMLWRIDRSIESCRCVPRGYSACLRARGGLHSRAPSPLSCLWCCAHSRGFARVAGLAVASLVLCLVSVYGYPRHTPLDQRRAAIARLVGVVPTMDH